MGMAPWPPTRPFPESQRDTVGDSSPDFPGSSGGREQGKFRPAKIPKLTKVAVCNDDGSVLGYAMVPYLEEIGYWIRALYAGMIAAGTAEDVTDGGVYDGL